MTFLLTTVAVDVVIIVEIEAFLDVFLPNPLEQLVTTLELLGLCGNDEGQVVADIGLHEECVPAVPIGGFGAGPLLRRLRGEGAFSLLLGLVEGMRRSELESL